MAQKFRFWPVDNPMARSSLGFDKTSRNSLFCPERQSVNDRSTRPAEDMLITVRTCGNDFLHFHGPIPITRAATVPRSVPKPISTADSPKAARHDSRC